MKKAKKCRPGHLCLVLWLLCLGCLLGIHRNVIRSHITGGRMPKAPSWHFWVQ